MRTNVLFTLLVLAVLVVASAIVFVEFRRPVPALKTGDLARLARTIVRNEDHVAPEELAQWLIEGRKDFILVDVRAQEDFESGAIDGAVHMTLPTLLTDETLDTLPTDRSIVVYSNGTDHAAQAVVVLRCSGLDAYSLLGGYNHWNARVLNPEITQAPDDERLEQIKRKASAWFFSSDYEPEGGLPMASEAPTAPEAFVPSVTPLAGPSEDTAEPAQEESEEGELIVEEGC